MAVGCAEMELAREHNRQVRGTDCKVLVSDDMFRYRRPGKTMLQMCEQLDYGVERGIV